MPIRSAGPTCRPRRRRSSPRRWRPGGRERRWCTCTRARPTARRRRTARPTAGSSRRCATRAARRSSTSPAAAPVAAPCATSASGRSSSRPRWRASTAARSTSASSSSRATCPSCGGWPRSSASSGCAPRSSASTPATSASPCSCATRGCWTRRWSCSSCSACRAAACPRPSRWSSTCGAWSRADWPWSVCAIGRAQLPLNAYCILAGGQVRTGLEDNLWFRRGEPATNGALVERIVRLATELDRPVATPDEARAILGLVGLTRPPAAAAAALSPCAAASWPCRRGRRRCP